MVEEAATFKIFGNKVDWESAADHWTQNTTTKIRNTDTKQNLQQLFLAPLATILPSIFWVFQLFCFLFTRSLWCFPVMLPSDAAALGASASIHQTAASLRCFAFPQVWPDVSFPDHPLQPRCSLAGCGPFSALPKELSPVGKTAWRGSFTGLSFLTCAYLSLSPWFFVGYIGCLKHVFHLRIDVCVRLDFFKKPDPCASLIFENAFGQAVPMGSISFSEEDTVELIYSLMEASWELIWLRWNFQTSKTRRH